MSDDAQQNGNDTAQANSSKDYDKIVEEVTERVLKLIREELRLEEERRGKSGRR